MAVVNFRDASVLYNSVDISNKVRSVTITMSAEDLDGTSMGATARTHVPGLRDDRMEFELYQDYAAGSVDATFAAQLGVAAGVTVVVKPTTAAVGTGNPSFTMTGVLLDYTPFDGEVGTLQMNNVSLVPAAGTAGIVRATA